MKLETFKILFGVFFLLFGISGCSIDKEYEIENLKENLSDYNNLREYIEDKYADQFSNTTRSRLVFLECVDAEKDIKDYICDDDVVLTKMKALGIKEVRFENKKCDDKFYGEVYFEKSKFSHYPTIYFLYERCGSGDYFESQNIFYQPVDENWGLYIDSSYP